jgi:hypothetical protein
VDSRLLTILKECFPYKSVYSKLLSVEMSACIIRLQQTEHISVGSVLKEDVAQVQPMLIERSPVKWKPYAISILVYLSRSF